MDSALQDYLDLAAKRADLEVPELLRRVLHVGTLERDPRFQALFGYATDETKSLVLALDLGLRLASPGLHYVFRSTYLGYRREEGRPSTTASERSQVFVSVVPRAKTLKLVLPLPPARFQHLEGCRDVTGQGHHGVGDLEVDVRNAEGVQRFLAEFSTWLAHGGAEQA